MTLAGERDILNLAAARLLCAAAPAHIFETVTAVLDCGGSTFTAKGKTVLRGGWKTVDAAFRAGLKCKPDKEEDGEDSAALPELAKGQTFAGVTAAVKEGKTSAPRPFTEDTLLAAMETAGVEYRVPAKSKDFVGEGGVTKRADNADLSALEHSEVRDDVSDDTERRGLGTPATRAGVLEKLVKSGFIERKKRQIHATEKGKNLIAILPDEIKSPLLTAGWETMLKSVERGELSGDEFMEGIASLTRGLVAAHAAPLPEYASLFAPPPKGAVIGKCPRCGADVTESGKGFFCSSRACKFALWKESRFWSAKGKTLNKETAIALLEKGRVSFTDLKSERIGKTYAATVVLVDADGKTDYRLEFGKEGENR